MYIVQESMVVKGFDKTYFYQLALLIKKENELICINHNICKWILELNVSV